MKRIVEPYLGAICSSILCFVYLLFLGSSASNAQSYRSAPPPPPDTNTQHAISVTSELVVIPVNVIDTNGNFVSGLNENNFRVYEEKRLQDLSLFQQEDAPVSVGLIVDHSASMGPKLSNVVAAVSAFANSGNPEDEMFVVDFNDNVTVEPVGGKSFTNSPTELGKAIEVVSAHGRTALYDAVAEGVTHLQLSHLQRKALIVISDGGDNASFCNRSQIVELARQSQVVIYSIALEDDTSEDQNPKLLRQLSDDTGGVAFFPKSEQAVVDLSAQIARDLRAQYVLGFVPEKRTGGNTFRKIQVQVTAPNNAKLRVRTRSGYSPPNERAALSVFDEKGFATRSADAATAESAEILRR
jgi:VWFA-related protein